MERTLLDSGVGHDFRRPAQSPVLDLVTVLCEELKSAGVSYCHWKSNEALDRSASGDNDLDLLVRRADLARFTELLLRLGFKEARLPHKRERPGVLHHYGRDPASGRLVHVDSQSQLLLGDDTTKNYRLPMEDAYLASAQQGTLFALPAPEYELAVFVIRMVVKHGTWDAIGYGRGRLNATEQRELAWLEERADPAKIAELVCQHLPYIGEALWQSCRQCLHPDATVIQRVDTARRLRGALAGNARFPSSVDTALRLWRRASWGTQRYLLGRRTKKRLASGGALIALVGGDGAGKSSAVEGVSSLLSQAFLTTRVHLGKPSRSMTTLVVKGPVYVASRFGLFPSVRITPWATTEEDWVPTYAWLIWHALNARDRYLEYARARRFAGRGGLVVCDRFPLPQLVYMDGTRTQSLLDARHLPRLARKLVELERRSYARINYPDVLIVLRVDPAIAVARRHDEEEDFVRRRNQEVWERDWLGTPAVVVDAGAPKADVLREILSVVWSRL